MPNAEQGAVVLGEGGLWVGDQTGWGELHAFKDGWGPYNVTSRGCHICTLSFVRSGMSRPATEGMPQVSTTATRVEDAWAEHRAYLVNLAFGLLGDIGEAEDVVQE